MALMCSIWSSINWQSSPWWSSKRPVNASTSAAFFFRIFPTASSASATGSRWPAISALIIARPETPMMSVATSDSLMPASSRTLCSRWT